LGDFDLNKKKLLISNT